MKKLISSALYLLPLLLIYSGCDSGTQSTQVQHNVELRWKADGSSLFGLMQSYSVTSTSTIPAVGYSIVRFDGNGSLAETFKTDPKSRPIDPITGSIDSYSPSLYVSADGSTIVTQLEGDLYRYRPQSGNLEKLATQLHLITVSGDLHYAVGTPSPDAQPIKTIQVFDLSYSPIRLVTHFDVNGVETNSGIWLNNGTFGINCADSIGAHISIYDTTSTGIPRTVIAGAEAVFHNAVFDPATNNLFVRNRNGSKTGTSFNYTVDRVNLTTTARANVLNFVVENFDVTHDNNVIVYSFYDSTSTIHMRSRNLVTSNDISIADDILLIIALSPSEDKLAYIRERDANFDEVHVIPFNKP
ncbi:MAG: hypothetical protein Q8919_03260 [Bacteroidota bacterium]|nr:hypothetical protein [Bacteroidota bacterium]